MIRLAMANGGIWLNIRGRLHSILGSSDQSFQVEEGVSAFGSAAIARQNEMYGQMLTGHRKHLAGLTIRSF
jgi:hypothetical protein